MTETDTRASLAVRLAALERRCRRLQALLAMLGIAATASVSLACRWPAPAPDVLDVRGFRLLDAKGRVHGIWELTEPAPGRSLQRLALFDGAGTPRFEVRLVDDEEVFVTVRDRAGTGRITQAVDRAEHPHLLLHDRANKPRLHAAVAASGAASLVCLDVDGRMSAGLGVHADGAPWLLPASGHGAGAAPSAAAAADTVVAAPDGAATRAEESDSSASQRRQPGRQ